MIPYAVTSFIQCYYMIPYAVTSFAPKLPSIPLPQVPWPPVPRRPWNFETSIDPNLCDLPDPQSYVTFYAVVVSMTSKCSILSNHMIYSMCHKCKNVCQTSMQILKYYSATTCTVPFANYLPILNQILILKETISRYLIHLLFELCTLFLNDLKVLNLAGYLDI